MQDIAEKAELSKATLYLYFPGKDDLFQEICASGGIQFREYFQRRIAGSQNALEILKNFWCSYLDIFGESEDLLIIFSMKHYLAPEHPFLAVGEHQDPILVDEFYTVLRNALAQGIREGFFDRAVSPDMLSKAILALFSNIIGEAAKVPRAERNPSKIIIEELRKLFQIILKGIAREGQDPSLFILPSSSKKIKKTGT
jgi:AcrR family transcriptional regulator